MGLELHKDSKLKKIKKQKRNDLMSHKILLRSPTMISNIMKPFFVNVSIRSV